MIELQRNTEPLELRTYRLQHPGRSWDDPDFQMLKPIVRRQLNHEQEGLCIYCEGKLHEDEGHLEHIKFKRGNPSLTFVYDNLAHSCDGPGHCGHHKQQHVLPIEPGPGCNRFFVLMAQDGILKRKNQQAEETVQILGLNAPSLARQRKSYIDAVCSLSNREEVDEFLSTAPFRWSLRGIFDPEDVSAPKGVRLNRDTESV